MKTIELINDKVKWVLGEDIPDIDLFFAQIWLTCFTNEFQYPTGRRYKKILSIFKGQHLWFYFDEQDSFAEAEWLVSKFIKKPEFTSKVNKQIIIEADKLRAFADNIPQNSLNRLSSKQLWRIFNKHDKIHTYYYQWCWIPVAADMFHNNLTNALKNYLIKIGVSKNQVNKYLVILTQPTTNSLIQIEHQELLSIALKIKQKLNRTHLPKTVVQLKRAAGNKIWQLLEIHWRKYYYVRHMWIGKDGVHKLDYYAKEIINLLANGVNPAKELNKFQQEFKKSLAKRRQLIKQLKIKKPWRTIIDSWGDFMVTKIYRRYAQIYEIYKMQPVLAEIARRLRINSLQARFMLKQEVKNGLLHNKINRAELAKRTKFCVFYNDKQKEVIYTGLKAQELARELVVREKRGISQFTGQTGCVGKAKGAVKIVIRPADMSKMNKGDILVSIATDPDIVPAMKKAAAIITEQGGVTSHAAIVSRELHIPCVIGTKIATRVLKDGDRVEVDATMGLVKKV